MSKRILFVVKFRERYDGSCGYDGTPACYGGLYHSALFVVQMLRLAGVAAKLVQVCDNNDIDREVAAFRPDIVVIEALWVVPEKFEVLSRLHPEVRWVVRLHSEIPFLAYEGIAMRWISDYVRHRNVSVACNSHYATRDVESVVGDDAVHYLPNFYPAGTFRFKRPTRTWDIGCFGATRPLKNQLLQGLAAIEFARQTNHGLRFHINVRPEQGGDSVLKNLRALFQETGFQLVEHGWAQREQFLAILSRTDIGMQVSFSETFDITAADTATLGIPLVTSKEVVWSAEESQADTTNAASIVNRLKAVVGYRSGEIVLENIARLRSYCNDSRAQWLKFCNA